jgi:hypothetical protein
MRGMVAVRAFIVVNDITGFVGNVKFVSRVCCCRGLGRASDRLRIFDCQYKSSEFGFDVRAPNQTVKCRWCQHSHVSAKGT